MKWAATALSVNWRSNVAAERRPGVKAERGVEVGPDAKTRFASFEPRWDCDLGGHMFSRGPAAQEYAAGPEIRSMIGMAIVRQLRLKEMERQRVSSD